MRRRRARTEERRRAGPNLARLGRELILGPAAAVSLLAATGAEAATNIQVDTMPGLNLGTTVTNKGSVYTINNGALVGANLFESFSSFSLAAGATARWTYTAGNPGSIANVINRVTGGAPSQISGALNSTALPNANFYFINPAGIIFGTGASVATGGAAHFSTASNLVFGDGAVFIATTATGSTLTVATPSAFGFLGGEGDISFSGVKTSFAKAGSSVSLVAADIQVSLSNLQFGHLDLISVGNQALSVPVTDPLTTSGFGGALTIGASAVTAQAPATSGAALDIGAGAVTLTGNTSVKSTAPTGQAGGSLIVAVASLSMDNSALSTSTATTASAGNVNVSATGSIQLTDHAIIESTSSSSGSAGSINLASPSLSLNKGTLSSTASSGSTGQSGSINLDVTGALTAQGSSIASTDASGDTGPIAITAQSLSMNDTSILSQASTAGAAGAITIDIGGALTLTNQSSVHSESQGVVFATTAGPVTMSAQSLVITNSNIEGDSAGSVSSPAISFDAAGGVTLNNSLITSAVIDGVTGPISFSAQSLTMNESGVLSEPSSSGPGGAINVDVSGAVTMTGQGANASYLHSVSRGADATGVAGAITITAQSVVVNDTTLVSNTYGDIDSGPINLNVAGPVSFVNEGGIAAQTFGAGAGGAVTVTAQSLLLDTGNLVSSTSGPNSAGSVTINVAGAVDIKNLGFIHSLSEAAGDGPAGDVTIRSPTLSLQTRAEILTNSFSANSGGNISIGNPDGSSMITVDGQYTVIESSNIAQIGGSGGDIQVYAGGLVVSNGAQIHTDASDGRAGSITLDFPRGGLLFVEGATLPGAITTNSASTEAGEITINNPSAIILDGSDIEAQGPSKGAFVTINSPAVLQSSDHENKFIVTGVVMLDGEYVDVSKSVAISDISFVDASKVLQGQCAALASSGETSRLTDTLKGPFAPAREKPVKAGTLAWRDAAPSTCGPAPGQN